MNNETDLFVRLGGEVSVVHIQHPRVVLFSLFFAHLAFGAFEPCFAELLQSGMLFFHQHGVDQHIRINGPVGIVVETDAVYGLQHPAVDIADPLCCPYLPPIGSGVLAGFVQADQPRRPCT